MSHISRKKRIVRRKKKEVASQHHKKVRARRKKVKKALPRVSKRKPSLRGRRKKKKTLSRPPLRHYYFLDPNFEFYGELKNLILKSPPASKEEIKERIIKLGKVRLAVLSGVFLNAENKELIDLLLVSDFIDKRKLVTFLRILEAEVGTELRFTVMDREEFDYRRKLFDRFLRVLFEGPHEILIDKIGVEA